MSKYRSHNCSELTENESEKKVYLSGWLHRKRDHGNLLFIDLRDHFGITQCVIENKLLEYIVKNIDRSYEAIFDLIDKLDHFSLSTGRSININLIKKALNK